LRKIEIELDEQIVETLEMFAARQNRSAAEFLAWGVSNYTRGFLMMALGEWMPREKWDALWRGENCPLCATIAASDQVDAYGCTVVDLSMGRLRLNKYPDTPGQCTFICKQHVCEPYYLSTADQGAFFAELMRVGQGLEKVYQPIKMNLQILGNTIPHLHCHLLPRYHGDFAPNGPLAPLSKISPLSLEELEAQSARILAALEEV
jgi:diadenosine tetraphosphate (Ap4A) HIT family hydrolase